MSANLAILENWVNWCGWSTLDHSPVAISHGLGLHNNNEVLTQISKRTLKYFGCALMELP